MKIFEYLLKIILPCSLILFSFGVCYYNRPLYMLCHLIIFAISSALLIMIYMNVYFISLTFIIIYIGAIMILFLFIIMMFNLRTQNTYISNLFDSQMLRIVYISIILTILSKIYYWLRLNIINILLNNLYFTNFAIYQYTNIKLDLQYYTKDIYIFSNLLYNQYGIILILTSIIMLISMFGSLVLVLKTNNKTTWKNSVIQN